MLAAFAERTFALPGGSFIVFAGRRNVHRAMVAFEDAGFHVRDLLACEKGAAHYRAQSLAKLYARRGMDAEAVKWAGWRLGNLAAIFEPIIWLFKPYTIGGTILECLKIRTPLMDSGAYCLVNRPPIGCGIA